MLDKEKIGEAVELIKRYHEDESGYLKDSQFGRAMDKLLSLASDVLEGKLVEAVSVEEITETIRLEYNRQKEFGMEPSFVDLAQAINKLLVKGEGR